MKKILLIGAATLMVSNPTFAGGILTNTNQHASFLRMIARGASIDIDGGFSTRITSVRRVISVCLFCPKTDFIFL